MSFGLRQRRHYETPTLEDLLGIERAEVTADAPPEAIGSAAAPSSMGLSSTSSTPPTPSATSVMMAEPPSPGSVERAAELPWHLDPAVRALAPIGVDPPRGTTTPPELPAPASPPPSPPARPPTAPAAPLAPLVLPAFLQPHASEPPVTVPHTPGPGGSPPDRPRLVAETSVATMPFSPASQDGTPPHDAVAAAPVLHSAVAPSQVEPRLILPDVLGSTPPETPLGITAPQSPLITPLAASPAIAIPEAGLAAAKPFTAADEPNGQLAAEPTVRGMRREDVAVVRVADRLVVLPIPIDLARSAGFDVVEDAPDPVLVAAGVDLSPTITQPENIGAGTIDPLELLCSSEPSSPIAEPQIPSSPTAPPPVAAPSVPSPTLAPPTAPPSVVAPPLVAPPLVSPPLVAPAPDFSPGMVMPEAPAAPAALTTGQAAPPDLAPWSGPPTALSPLPAEVVRSTSASPAAILFPSAPPLVETSPGVAVLPTADQPPAFPIPTSPARPAVPPASAGPVPVVAMAPTAQPPSGELAGASIPDATETAWSGADRRSPVPEGSTPETPPTSLGPDRSVDPGNDEPVDAGRKPKWGVFRRKREPADASKSSKPRIPAWAQPEPEPSIETASAPEADGGSVLSGSDPSSAAPSNANSGATVSPPPDAPGSEWTPDAANLAQIHVLDPTVSDAHELSEERSGEPVPSRAPSGALWSPQLGAAIMVPTAEPTRPSEAVSALTQSLPGHAPAQRSSDRRSVVQWSLPDGTDWGSAPSGPPPVPSSAPVDASLPRVGPSPSWPAVETEFPTAILFPDQALLPDPSVLPSAALLPSPALLPNQPLLPTGPAIPMQPDQEWPSTESIAAPLPAITPTASLLVEGPADACTRVRPVTLDFGGMTKPSPVVIRGLDLVRVFHIAGQEIPALRGVSIEIRAGELLAITGPSGSGKTTLLNCLSGLDEITSGQVFIGDQDLAELSDAERARHRATAMGFVFQQANLLPAFNAVENVQLPLLLNGWNKRLARQHAEAALERVGLCNRAEFPPGALSGGEQQRVAVARALVGDPQIVWADEPTGNLDVESAAQVLDLLDELNESGLTVLLVTHDEQIAGAAPRRVVLRDGRVVADTMPAPQAQPLGVNTTA